MIVLSEKVQKYFKKFYDRDTVLIPNGVMTHENRKANLITQKFDFIRMSIFVRYHD